MKFLMFYPNFTGYAKVPIGITYLLKILKDNGHTVRLFDLTFYGVEIEKNDAINRGKYLNYKDVDLKPYGVVYNLASLEKVKALYKAELEEFKPDVVGFSIIEDNSIRSLEFVSYTKRVLPSVKIMVGGVFTMIDPDYVMANPDVDIVCIGEGENAIVEAMRLLPDNKHHHVTGMWVRTETGEIIKNPIAPVTDLSTLPFLDLSLIDERHVYGVFAGEVYRMSFIEGMRGCPRKCSYCANQIFFDTYKRTYLRKKDNRRLIDELAYVKNNFGINFFSFLDDNFTIRKEEEIREFAEMYKREIGLPFWLQVEAQSMTETKIALLKDAGCVAAGMGIESGSDYILKKVYNRNTSKKTTLKAFEIMHKYGLRTSANIIIGAPHESRKEVFESIEFTRECQPSTISLAILIPYRGTAIREYCVSQGYVDKDFVSQGGFMWKSSLKLPQITNEEIQGFLRTFVLYATLPKEYWPEIEKCEKNIDGENETFEKLEKLFWEIAETRRMNIRIPGFDYDAIRKWRNGLMARPAMAEG